MKIKNVILFIVASVLIFSFVSCSHKIQSTYSVLEVGGYDNLSGANHKVEIDLENEKYIKKITALQKNVNVNGTELNVNYKNSQKSYFYKNDIDYYEKKSGDTYVKIGINEKTERMDDYAWIDKKYVDQKKTPIITEEECLDIARSYLDKYISSSEYELIETRYHEIPEYKAIYDFEFVRVIDGIKTCDSAYIGVIVYGDVISHLFISLGEMVGASLPNDEEMQVIQEKVEKKIETIYENISEEFEISHEISDKIFIRLSDGKFALEYYVKTDLKKQDSATITETTKLLVYV